MTRLAAAVTRAQVEEVLSNEMELCEEVEFSAKLGRVRGVARTMLGAVVWEERALSARAIDDEAAARALASAIAADPARLGLEDAGSQWLERVAFLRAHFPELGVPDLLGTDDDASESLVQFVWGCRSLAEVKRRRAASGQGAGLSAYLTRQQRSALSAHAPASLEVPSGSSIRLAYEGSAPPTLSVRIQEIFGMLETPLVADGRVKVVLHLLAPNYRPAQVTTDLPSFWTHTYPEIRKELRARYAKHPWPEDPRSAKAVRK